MLSILMQAVNPLDFLEPGAVALLIAVLLAVAVAVPTAFIKKIVVPGSMYEKSEQQVDKLQAALESLTKANDKGFEALREEIVELRREIRYRGGA